MFCPNCGSNNQAEVAFCTRCGTNLGAVSEALSGRISRNEKIDERMVKLLKDYYRGRRSAAFGGAALVLAALKVALFSLFNISQGTFAIAELLIVFGIITLLSGLAKWNSAASEIKAIEQVASKGAAMRRAEDRPGLTADDAEAVRTSALSTDPLDSPPSVTEHTTRQLEDGAYRSSMRNQSRQPE